MPRIETLMVSIAVALGGCAGNGKGLDQNGQPITAGGGSSGAVTADLQSIEENVFTPICSKCHAGASAPEGLELDAQHAYQDLVNVPSVEQPSLMRVKPGDPDSSYMVHKIEGLPGIVGGQMPLGETPLPQATIDAIRQWISNGAPNVPGAAAPAAERFTVSSMTPEDGATVPSPLAQMLVAFTHELDATLLNDSTVVLERLPEATPLAAVRIAALELRVPEENARVLVLRPRAPLQAGRYRLTLRGSGGGAVADLGGQPLSSDVTAEFTVGGSP